MDARAANLSHREGWPRPKLGTRRSRRNEWLMLLAVLWPGRMYYVSPVCG
jgi:hypothetical protein